MTSGDYLKTWQQTARETLMLEREARRSADLHQQLKNPETLRCKRLSEAHYALSQQKERRAWAKYQQEKREEQQRRKGSTGSPEKLGILLAGPLGASIVCLTAWWVGG